MSQLIVLLFPCTVAKCYSKNAIGSESLSW